MATSSDGWLQRREEPATVSPIPCSNKRQLRQLDIREFGAGDEIDPVIRDALVSGREGDGYIEPAPERIPRDVTLASRDHGSADREVWAIRAKRRMVVRSGESRRIKTNLILPPTPHPYATKIASPDPHWLSELQLLKVKTGVLNTKRGGRLNVDIHNPTPNAICLRLGSVIGQLVREPYLDL